MVLIHFDWFSNQFFDVAKAADFRVITEGDGDTVSSCSSCSTDAVDIAFRDIG